LHGPATRIIGDYYFSRTAPDLADPAVFSIVGISGATVLNRWATAFVQSEHARLKYDGGKLMGVRPLHDRGITGAGVTVAVIDSGIDTELCQFKDPDREIPFDRDDRSHRKIVRYDAFADRSDSSPGHGTHVCGILAGKALCRDCTAALYDGHAPDAKIYFVDCGNQTNPRSLILDLRLSDVFQAMDRLDCEIMSNSWGFPTRNGELGYRVLFDAVAYKKRNVLMVFGAGNSRRKGDIYAPASSKNVLGVGGATNWNVIKGIHGNWVLVLGIRRIALNRYRWSAPPRVMLDHEPHAQLRNMEIGTGFVVIGTSCEELRRVRRNVVSVFAPMNESWKCGSVPFPVFGIERSDLARLRPGVMVSLDLNFTPSDSWTMPKFNSAGPSDSGLVKPDLVAPGQHIISARQLWNHSKCSAGLLEAKSGSSFAVPAVSGAAALIVQYFRGGWFPRSFRPSGMLLKAVLVNGASPRHVQPDLNSGFGLIHLDNVLAFPESDFRLLIGDELNITTGQELVANVTVLTTSSMTVTLSYVDPPTSHLGNAPLYADLDLIVETPDGRKLYPNECRQVNERVHIGRAVPGVYRIRVLCWQMFQAKHIHFAVAAVGRFANSGFLEFVRCDPIRIQCDELHTGHFCEIKVEDGFSGSFISRGRRFNYFSLKIPELSEREALQLHIEALPVTNALTQVELSHRQFAKFGGDLLHWQALNQSDTSLTIYWDDIDGLVAGSRLYVSIFTATEKQSQFMLRSEIKMNVTRKRPARTSAPPSLASPVRGIHWQQTFSSAKSVFSALASITVVLLCLCGRTSRVNESSLSDLSTFPMVPMAKGPLKRETSKGSDTRHTLGDESESTCLDVDQSDSSYT
jgi:subtilisin family serine protease